MPRFISYLVFVLLHQSNNHHQTITTPQPQIFFTAEDVTIAQAWCNVLSKPIQGADQKGDVFWKVHMILSWSRQMTLVSPMQS